MLKFSDIVGLADFIMRTRACGGAVKVFDGAEDQPREVLIDYGITEAIVKEYNNSQYGWKKDRPTIEGFYWVRFVKIGDWYIEVEPTIARVWKYGSEGSLVADIPGDETKNEQLPKWWFLWCRGTESNCRHQPFQH